MEIPLIPDLSIHEKAPYSKDSDRMDRINTSTDPVSPVQPTKLSLDLPTLIG